MKKILILCLVFSGATVTGYAHASKVFKCVDENGMTMFSFAPCAPVSQPAVTEKPVRNIEDELRRLERVDEQISTLNRRFRDLRLEQEEALRKTADFSSRKDIREKYRKRMSALVSQIAKLKSERGELIQGSISLITSTAP